jgi:hypothetical protein
MAFLRKTKAMPITQTLTLHAPTMMRDFFFVEKTSKAYQPWVRFFSTGDTLECFLEREQIWVEGVIESYCIPDGSGNAPAANAHFFLTWKDRAGTWKYDLHTGLQVRLEVPTDEELIAASGWCEGGDWESEYNGPSTYTSCSQRGQPSIAPSGQKCWYCEAHKPAWVISA